MTIKSKSLSYLAAAIFLIGGFFVFGHHALAAPNFAAQEGNTSYTTYSNSFTISNSTPTCGHSMHYTWSVNWGGDPVWFSPNGDSTGGTLACGASTNVSVSPTSAIQNLSAGTHTAIITVSGTDVSDSGAAENSTQTVSATITISSSPSPICTIVVSSTGNSTGYTYHFTGSNNFSGSGDTTYPNEPSGSYTVSYTGGASQSPTSITPSSTQTCSAGGSITFTFNFPSGGSTCTVVVQSTGSSTGYSYTISGPGSFSGSGDHTYTNEPVGFWTATYNGGGQGGYTGVTPSNGQCNAGQTITFTFNFTTVSSTCTIIVNSTGNSAGYSYSISGASNFSGSGDNTYASKPAGSYTAAYSSGASQAPTSITPSANQNCSAGGSITFTFNFPSSVQTCTVNVTSSGGSSGYTYSFTGPGSFSGSGNASYPGESAGTWTATYTGGASQSFLSVSPAASQNCPAGGSVTFQFNFSGSSCTIQSFTASNNSIAQDTSVTLSWTTTGCQSAVLDGGAFTEQTEPANGSVNSGSISGSTQYSLCAIGGPSPVCRSYEVYVVAGGGGGSCTINVTHTGNAGPYNFYYQGSTGGANLGTGDTVFKNQLFDTWKIYYNGGATGTLESITPSTASCTPSNSSITFVLNFTPGTNLCQISYLLIDRTNSGEYPNGIFTSGLQMDYGTQGQIKWSASGCTSTTLSGNKYGAATSVAATGIDTYSPITSAQYVDFNACGPNNCDYKRVNWSLDVVGGGGFCQIVMFTDTALGNNTYRLDWAVNGCAQAALSGGKYGTRSDVAFYGTDTVSPPAITTYCLSVYATTNGFQNSSCLQLGPTIPPDVTNVVAQNSAQNNSIPCGQIQITWNGAGASSYNLYRSTNSSASGPLWQTTTNTSYTDTSPTVGTTYYYWVQSVNQMGSGNKIISNSVSAVGCSVNLSTSTKNVIAINGAPYSFSSTCIPGQTGSVNVIKKNDRATMEIAVCNTGTAAANSVTVTDDLANENLSNLRNVSISGGSGTSYSTNGTKTTFNLGTINPGFKATITFDVDVTAPSGNNEPLLRFNNNANITYTSGINPPGSTGCVGTSATNGNPCPVKTGYIVFYNGLKAPVIKEVNP